MGTSVEDAKRDYVSDRLDALLLEQQETNRLLRRLLVPVELMCRYFWTYHVHQAAQRRLTLHHKIHKEYALLSPSLRVVPANKSYCRVQHGLFAPPARLYPCAHTISCPNHTRTPGP